MKKLLISTALVSSVLTGVAFSQTTITGEMRIGYKTHFDTVEKADSARGFGTEQQINIQNKGKTNFGWDYASGFSIEVDANATTLANTNFDENVFIDFINPSSGTTLSISRDHIQRSDSARNASVAFGFDAVDVVDGAVSDSVEASSLLIQASPGTNAGQSFGFAIIQDIAKLGKVSYSYIPNTTEAGTSEGMGQASGSAYEVGFTGGLGVAGLNTYAFKGKKDNNRSAGGEDPSQTNFGISYNTGPITAGVEYTKHVGRNAAVGVNANDEIKEKGYGLAYAVNKDLSLQIHHTTAKQDSSVENAKVTSIQAGYNLGPVALIVGAGKYDGILGGANEDGKTIFTRLLTAF
jgi:hypothetical protein